MKSGVYEIFCSANGKKYIGSSMRIKIRLREHRYNLNRGCHPNKHLQSAWNKYDSKTFTFTILEFCEDVDQLLKREQWHLDQSGIKFNICKIAGSTFGIKQPPRTETQRVVWAEIARNRIRSDEEKAKISASLKGRKLGPYSEERKLKAKMGRRGLPVSEETKAKLRVAHKGRKLPERTPEIDAKIRVALKAAWIRRKARQQTSVSA